MDAGRTPCPRDYSGGNQQSGLAVTIFDLAPERAGCKGRKLEASFLTDLRRVASYGLRGSELELLDKEGMPVMRLVAQPGLRDFPWRVVKLDITPGARRATRRNTTGPTPLILDFGASEVLEGNTGRSGFSAFYTEPGGASLEITDARPSIRGCRGSSRRTAECRQESRFFEVLRRVDGYEMRSAANQMVLLAGNKVSMILEPDVAAQG